MSVTYCRSELYESHFNHSINQAIKYKHFNPRETQSLTVIF